MSGRRGNFFFELVHLKVGQKLYAAPRHHLEAFSAYFAERFEELFSPDESESKDESDEGEGRAGPPPNPPPPPRNRIGTEANPLVLEDCSNEEFEALIHIIVAPSTLQVDLPKAQWVFVLKLATMWRMPETRAVAISNLASAGLSISEKVGLGRRYQVAEWLTDAVTPLINGTEDLDLDALAELVGWEATARIAYTFRKPHRSKIVSVHPNYWKCPFCNGQMWKGTYPWERPRRKETRMKCASCGEEVSLQDGAGKTRDVRIDVADFYDQPRRDGLGDLREIMGHEWREAE